MLERKRIIRSIKKLISNAPTYKLKTIYKIIVHYLGPDL